MSKCSDFLSRNFSCLFLSSAGLIFSLPPSRVMTIEIQALQLVTDGREIGRDKLWVAQPSYWICAW